MKNYNSLVGLSPELRAVLADTSVSGLPPIRGSWFVVDPYKVTDASGGVEGVFANIADAYDACVDGRGDGILVLSGGKTSATNTSYLKKTLAWSKYNITVVGVASGNGYYGRARVANLAAMTAFTTMGTSTTSTMQRTAGSFVTDGIVVGGTYTIACSGSNNAVTFTATVVTALEVTASGTPFTAGQTPTQTVSTVITPYLVELVTVSGENNVFYNINFTNACLSTLALGAVSVTANRNHFVNCHFNGGDNTSRAAQTTDYDCTVASSENVFDRCYFGNNNQIRAATNGNLVLGVSTTAIGQNYFNDCVFVSYSATTTRGAILVTNAATLGGYVVFNRCIFTNWNSGAESAIATIVVGATPNNVGLLFHNCASVGYAALSANDDKSFSTGPTANAGTGMIAQEV
jgi:hypothetical protein